MQSPRGRKVSWIRQMNTTAKCCDVCVISELLRFIFIKNKFKISLFATFSVFWVPDWSAVNSWLPSEIKEILL